MKKIFSLVLTLFVFLAVNAQSHNYIYPECRLGKRPQTTGNSKIVSSGMVCPGCEKRNEDERQVRKVEDQRRAEVAAAAAKALAAKIEADRVAADIIAKKQEEERKQKIAAKKDLDEYNRNPGKFLDGLRVKTKNYDSYDAVKASQKIPAKIKILKLVENRFASQYEIFSGEELVKTFEFDKYWVHQLYKDLPYFIVKDKKSNLASIIDSKGEAIVIDGEKKFSSIFFSNENKTIVFINPIGKPEFLVESGAYYDVSNSIGDYHSSSDAMRYFKVCSSIAEEKYKLWKATTQKGTAYLDMPSKIYLQEIKKVVAALDLEVLDASTVHRIDRGFY